MRDPNAYFLTTAIDYPNSRPHIGTAFEKIGADVQARFRRMEGTPRPLPDGQRREHHQGLAGRREAAGSSPSPTSTTWPASSARSGRRWRSPTTTSSRRPRNATTSAAGNSSRRSTTPGDIYKKPYTGLYCDGCEAFKTEKEIVDGRCPNHPNRDSARSRRRITSSASPLRRPPAGPLRGQPRLHPAGEPAERDRQPGEVGPPDVSITRKGFTWGIPVPFDPEQTIYVWFDALLNYITAIGYGTDEARFAETWPADVHVIGKDITRFHCALWPAMLMSAGLPLPRRVFAHGFVYNKGAKISKSGGTAIDPMAVYKEYGSDAFRYYFMRECPFGGDGNFSEERFADLYNSDLADKLGNYYSRTLSMCVKYFGTVLCRADAVDATAWLGGVDLVGMVADLRTQVGTFQYSQALQRIWLELLEAANKYITVTQPFKLAKTDPEACRVVLVNLAEAVRVIAILIKPFPPPHGRDVLPLLRLLVGRPPGRPSATPTSCPAPSRPSCWSRPPSPMASLSRSSPRSRPSLPRPDRPQCDSTTRPTPTRSRAAGWDALRASGESYRSRRGSCFELSRRPPRRRSTSHRQPPSHGEGSPQ